MKYFIKYNEHINKDITLYHGSYTKFDRFDSNKIRKTSGQTTYGVGIYATDNVKYAESYINGENGDNLDSIGYLYTLEIKNANFLHFGYYINGKVEHSVIDYNNFKKIQYQLEKENIYLNSILDEDDINNDISSNDTTWDVFYKINKYFYKKLPINQQFNYGDFHSKKLSGDFLIRCGIDGLRYPLDSSSKMSTSHGYDGYGYVIYDTNSINIKKVEAI